MKKDNEVHTRLLSEPEVQLVLKGLPSLMRDLAGDCIVIAEYGWGCNIHNDLQYKPMEVGVAWLDGFISDSIEQRIFVPASSDLSVSTPEGGCEILFCHESDIHISGGQRKLVQQACEHPLLKELIDTEMRTRKWTRTQ